MLKAMSPVLLGLAALPLGGCQLMASGGGALLGNLFVLAVTVGIFFGTLGLGRSPQRTASSTSTADRSQSNGEQPRT